MGGVLSGFFEGDPVAAVVEEDEAGVGEVVEGGDADFEDAHSVVAAPDTTEPATSLEPISQVDVPIGVIK